MGYTNKEDNYVKIKTKKIILSIIGIIVLLFILFHSNPILSVRSKLFLSGHPALAFKSSVEINDFQTNLDRETLVEEDSKIYKITNVKSYDNSPFNFKVKKIGILYFASSYGEA